MKTVSFHGTCAAGATVVLVSKRIGHPYEVKHITCTFAPGCDNLMQVKFYTSYDDEAPAAAEPSDISMLRDYGQVDYVIGNANQKRMEHDLEVNNSGSYLKVYANNSDTFDHSVDVQMEIEEKDRR